MPLTVAIGTIADLEVFNIKVAPVLKGVVVEVASTSVAVVTGTGFLEVVEVKIGVSLIVVRLVAWTRRGRDSREQSLPRHIRSVGLLVVE